MSKSHRLIRIFVASPSDIQEERIRLNTVVTELNQPQALADQLGCTLQLLDWREVVPGAGRPEEVILDQLPVESWDIFIGMLWHRFGTPPGGQDVQVGQIYKSGTEEEFKLAYRAWQETQRPHVLFYRCKALPLSMDDIEPEQLAKVRNFWQEFGESGEHPALFHQYQTHADFERRVRQDLNKLLPRLMPPIDQGSAKSQSDFDESLATVDEVGELAPTVIEWLKRDEQAIRSFFSYYRQNEIDVTDTLQVLEQLHGWHLVYSKADQWFFTKVGVMLFGPAEKLVRYVYTDVLIDNKEAGSFKSCNGYPLMRLLVELIETLKPLWKKVGDDPSRRDDKGRPIRFSLYPQTALIEAAVNLVIHRDYEDNDPAHVVIYEDRIEFVNPGTSPYDETELLAEKEFWPKYDRNPHLINVVSRTELNQRQGGGIARIIRALRENGNVFSDGRPALEIVNDKEQNRFKLVIYRRDKHDSRKVSSLHVPLQRPPRIEHFTGREKELNQLIADLQPGQVVTLTGPGGIGKSALAAEAVWRLAPGHEPPEAFPDGVIFYSFYDQSQAEIALEHIARTFGEEPIHTPKAAALRALAGRRTLLLLDGTENADDLQSVLEVRGDCGILITSRKRQDAVAERQDIPPLSTDDVIKLLEAWTGAAAEDKTAFQQISELVGGLPLAVRLVGRYLAETGENAAEYLEWLKQTPLEALDQGQRQRESIVRLLERSLAQVSNEAQQVVGVVGILALAPFTQKVIAEVLPEIHLRQALADLVRYNLLVRVKSDIKEATPQNLYEISHPLIHTYAQKQIILDVDYILGRLVAYYFAFVRQQNKFAPQDYYTSLDLERPHILRIIAVCVEQELFDEAQDLVWAIDGYLEARGRFSERLLALEMGLKAAQKVNNLYTEAAFLGSMGSVVRDLGQFEQAIEYYQQALATISPISDKRGKAAILGNLGLAYRDLGQVDQAIAYYQQALTITREVGDRWGEGNHLGNLGLAYHDLGQTKQAIEYYQQALVIARENSDRRGEAVTLSHLGLAYHDLGEVGQAIDHLQQSLKINQQLLGLEHPETVQVLNNLGFLLRAKGDYEGARPYIEQALTIRERILGLEHLDTAQSLTNLGFLLDRMTDYDRARPYFERALAIIEKVRGQKHPDTATSLNNLGALLVTMEDYTDARPYLERALAIREKLLGASHPDTATTLYTMGVLLELIEDYEVAHPYLERAFAIWGKDLSSEYLNAQDIRINLVDPNDMRQKKEQE